MNVGSLEVPLFSVPMLCRLEMQPVLSQTPSVVSFLAAPT